MESDQFPPELQSETFEVLSSNDNTAMETLFSHLYSPHQQHRSEAVTFLQCSKHHHPDLLFTKLVFILTSSPDVHTRANAARAISLVQPAHLWPKLRPLAQAHLQAHLIHSLAQETSTHVLRLVSPILAETVSVIYKTHKSHSHSPENEILDFLLSSVSSNDDKSREFALLVFASLPNDCRSLVSESLIDRDGAVRVLHSSFLTSLSSRNPDVQVASFGAVVNLVRFLFSEPSLFHELLRAMMVGVFALLHGFERSYFKSAFAELINLVSREPVLLRPYMSDMVLDALQIAESNGVSDGTHRLAFELVLAMTEVKEWEEQVVVNLNHQTVVRLFLVPMKMLLPPPSPCVEEDRELEEGDGFGIKCLKKLCVALGESKVMPVAHELLPIYLDATDWKKRHAGITLLTVIANEFSDEMVLMENFLGEVVTKVLKLFQDSHVGVRLAAFALMEMPINLVQAAQILYHHRFVHAFSIALGSEQDNKGKEQAASAMLFFLKNTLPESLPLYKNMDIVMGKLLSLLQDKASAKQRSIALSTFNIVAQHCHEVAHKYCADYLPILLESCSDKNSEIKEEAARGIRICAEFGTPQFKPFVNRILSELGILMKDPSRSLSENAKACDVAVSALGRICEFHRDSIDGSKIVPSWLSFLPLKDDLVEAKIMHEQLCVMVARLDKDLLGVGNQNLVKIIAVFLEVIDKSDKLATAQTINHMNTLLKQFGRHIPRSAFDTILLSLNAQQRELLLPLVSS